MSQPIDFWWATDLNSFEPLLQLLVARLIENLRDIDIYLTAGLANAVGIKFGENGLCWAALIHCLDIDTHALADTCLVLFSKSEFPELCNLKSLSWARE